MRARIDRQSPPLASVFLARIFENRSDAIRHGLCEAFEESQTARIAAAVSLSDDGESSIGTAARLAGRHRFDVRETLEARDSGSVPKTELSGEMKSMTVTHGGSQPSGRWT
jgi:Arc/MetJ-type ribon-helix-helix transcriptional regulator